MRGGLLSDSNRRARVFANGKRGSQCGRESQGGGTHAGHAKASMTPDVYDDVFDADLDEVADRLDAALTNWLDWPPGRAQLATVWWS